MKIVDTLHHHLVLNRRVRVLARHLADAIPRNASVLDVGAGDGRIAEALLLLRPDLRLRGVDVLVRSRTAIPVDHFDGKTIPFGNGDADIVMLVDVLHHTDNPLALLKEARRVARVGVVVKDHDSSGFLAKHTLRFMDDVGNRRHGVRLPYNYWNHDQWARAFADLSLRPAHFRDRLGLYPWPASALFDRRLHFVARLEAAQ